MTYPPYIREKARELRRTKKLTIDEIAERLAISRTTAFYWVRDLEIPRKPIGWPIGAREKGNRAMRRKYRLLREAAYRLGVDQFEVLSEDPEFRDFVCLFITEGYRRSSHGVAIANSDLAVIKLADRWIRRLTDKQVRYTFQHHADQDPGKLIEFWSDELRVDPGAFTFQRKSNSGGLRGRNWRSPHGVLTVLCHDTYLRCRMQAWVDRVKDEWMNLGDR